MALDPDVAKRLAKAARRAEEFTQERNGLIIEASKNGASLREIASHARISHIGVKKIVDKANRFPTQTVARAATNDPPPRASIDG